MNVSMSMKRSPLGIAPAAAVADGDDVITFGDGTEVYGDAFCGVGVGGGIHVAVAAVQGVAAGTAVERVIAVVAHQSVAAGAASQRVVLVVRRSGCQCERNP